MAQVAVANGLSRSHRRLLRTAFDPCRVWQCDRDAFQSKVAYRVHGQPALNSIGIDDDHSDTGSAAIGAVAITGVVACRIDRAGNGEGRCIGRSGAATTPASGPLRLRVGYLSHWILLQDPQQDPTILLARCLSCAASNQWLLGAKCLD